MCQGMSRKCPFELAKQAALWSADQLVVEMCSAKPLLARELRRGAERTVGKKERERAQNGEVEMCNYIA